MIDKYVRSVQAVSNLRCLGQQRGRSKVEDNARTAWHACFCQLLTPILCMIEANDWVVQIQATCLERVLCYAGKGRSFCYAQHIAVLLAAHASQPTAQCWWSTLNLVVHAHLELFA